MCLPVLMLAPKPLFAQCVWKPTCIVWWCRQIMRKDSATLNTLGEGDITIDAGGFEVGTGGMSVNSGLKIGSGSGMQVTGVTTVRATCGYHFTSLLQMCSDFRTAGPQCLISSTDTMLVHRRADRGSHHGAFGCSSSRFARHPCVWRVWCSRVFAQVRRHICIFYQRWHRRHEHSDRERDRSPV